MNYLATPAVPVSVRGDNRICLVSAGRAFPTVSGTPSVLEAGGGCPDTGEVVVGSVASHFFPRPPSTGDRPLQPRLRPLTVTGKAQLSFPNFHFFPVPLSHSDTRHTDLQSIKALKSLTGKGCTSARRCFLEMLCNNINEK